MNIIANETIHFDKKQNAIANQRLYTVADKTIDANKIPKKFNNKVNKTKILDIIKINI